MKQAAAPINENIFLHFDLDNLSWLVGNQKFWVEIEGYEVRSKAVWCKVCRISLVNAGKS